MNNNLMIWPDVGSIMDDLFNKNYTRDLRVHVNKEDDKYLIISEVPGINEDDLKVEFKNDFLTIKAEYKEENKEVLRKGDYSWSCRFNDINPEKVDAKLKNGILKIVLYKKDEVKPKLIKIKSE